MILFKSIESWNAQLYITMNLLRGYSNYHQLIEVVGGRKALTGSHAKTGRNGRGFPHNRQNQIAGIAQDFLERVFTGDTSYLGILQLQI